MQVGSEEKRAHVSLSLLQSASAAREATSAHHAAGHTYQEVVYVWPHNNHPPKYPPHRKTHVPTALVSAYNADGGKQKVRTILTAGQ